MSFFYSGKFSKLRLTGLAASNAVGEKLPMFGIGKSANPRCFKHIKSLPCKYRSQKKSWMNSEIFTNWVKHLDRTMIAEGRKIALIVDNCPAHPHVEGLEAVKLVFLPPNTTSKLQPMDQGVIRALKAKYRSAIVKMYITYIEAKGEVPKISILDAMKFLVQAWNRVSKETIQNCFRCAGIYLETQADAIEDNDDPFKSLQSDMDELKLLDPTLVPDGTTAEDFTDADQTLSVAESATTDDDEILNHYRESCSIDVTSDNDDEESSEEPGPPQRPAQSEIFVALELLQNCTLFEEEQVASHLRTHLEKFSMLYEKTLESRKQQSKIDNFFTRL